MGVIMRRVLISVVGAVVLVATNVVVTGVAAEASTLIVCVGPETTHYDPPLTLTSGPTDIDADANYVLCLGGPISGSGTVSGASPSASCLAISTPVVTETVTFNNNQTDVINYTTAVAARVGGFNIVTLTGTVATGPHQGRTAVKTVQLTPIPEPTACVGNGLDVATGITQLEILG
jgi:hypothetical protein